MASITTRAGKGSPLTHAEVDGNFNNLNADKLDSSGIALGSAASPTIKFTGDSDTGLYSPGANQVALSTGGTERLRITSAGLVGIGTTSPGRKLEVSDASVDNFVRVNTTGASKSGIEFSNGGTAYAQLYFNNVAPYDFSLLQQYSTGSLIFGTNNTERARIDSSGRLLVGTSSSRQVNGSIQALQLQIEGTTYNSSSMSLVTNQNNIDGSYIVLGKSRGASLGSSTVVSSGDSLGAFWFCGADGTDLKRGATIEAFVDGTPGANDMPGRLVFSTTADGASSPTERLRIDSSGRLGIGTSSPTTKLQVGAGNPGADTSIAKFQTGDANVYALTLSNWIGGATNYGPKIAFDNSSRASWVIGAEDGGGSFVIQDRTSGTAERLKIDANGICTIPSSSTSAGGTLFVDNPNNTSGSGVATLGNRANTNNTSSYYLVCQEPGVVNRCAIFGNGDVRNTNGVFGAISDVKLKENIVDAASQWNDIKSLQVRKYNFKEGIGYQTHTQIGLIAQEAELVSPGLVDTTADRDADGNDLGSVTKSVNYSVLYMKAVKALQEAMERIETLEAKVATLERL